jgi:hypothetical protein
MIKPIYASKEHEVIMLGYLETTKQLVKEVSDKDRYKNYLDVYEVIIEYHNNYGNGVEKSGWYDWLSVLPANLSVMTNGYFAALESKSNAATIRAYRTILNDMLEEVVMKLSSLKVNE